MLTRDELDAIRRRADAATEGPWTDMTGASASGGDEVCVNGGDYETICEFPFSSPAASSIHCVVRKNNIAFIAAARTDIPRLLDDFDELARRAKAAGILVGNEIPTPVATLLFGLAALARTPRDAR